MPESDIIGEFLREYGANPVGISPPRPEMLPPDEDEENKESYNFVLEVDSLADWRPILLREQPVARPGEFPELFIDGSHYGQPVFCVRSPAGYPVAMVVAEVGAVAMKLTGRYFERRFASVERVFSFVIDPFPWERVESLGAAMENHSALALRLLPARMPASEVASPFDYEALRQQASNRCQNEMLKLEVLALGLHPDIPTLVDGQLGGRVGAREAEKRALLVGVVKSPRIAPLHPAGHCALLDLKPAHRTPYFLDQRMTQGKVTDVPIVSWYLRLSGGPRSAPNWGIVRVDVPWVQMQRFPVRERSAFVDRLSRWLVDARCRTESYARMPVSLDPIVRAEEALKPLFTPMSLLVNRLYRTAGLFRRNEP